jgi:uridine phosphorylase
VLVAEQLFAAGCQLLVSVTSAGRIAAGPATPRFVLIRRALRDEGTSYHYVPAAPWSTLAPDLLALLTDLGGDGAIDVAIGSTWTTDAPFRETADQVERYRRSGVLGVEMEAAALYAFATAREQAVVCFAHLTNGLGQEGDFEKGPDDGAVAMLRIVEAVAELLASTLDAPPPGLPGKRPERGTGPAEGMLAR